LPHKPGPARRAYYAKYRDKNRQRIAGYHAKYLTNNRSARAETIRISNLKSAPRKAIYRERHREQLRESGRMYVKRNRAACNARLAAYRAAKRAATPPWADQIAIRRIYRRAAYLQTTTGVKYHVDHVIPLVNDRVCGLHVEGNLRVLTAIENQRKGNLFE
jgi:hypothetical protein